MMPLGKKIGLVAGALVVSMAAASAFRRDLSHGGEDASLATDPARQFVEPVTRRLTADSSARPPRAHTPFHLAPQADHGFSSPPAATGAATREITSLPTGYHQSLSPVGALLRPLAGEDAGDLAEADGPGAPELFPASGPAAGPRTHKIADGDTLTRLAAEYLGGSERYLEIYALNRDILNSPDLLPIGKTLKIPATDSRPEPTPGRPHPGPADAASHKLVPIPPGTLRRAND